MTDITTTIPVTPSPAAPPVRPEPVVIRMHERDNVAIVGNDGGLPAGTTCPMASCCANAYRKDTRSR